MRERYQKKKSSRINIKRPELSEVLAIFWGLSKTRREIILGFFQEGSNGRIDTQYFPRDQPVYVLDTKLKPFMVGKMSKRIGRGGHL